MPICRLLAPACFLVSAVVSAPSLAATPPTASATVYDATGGTENGGDSFLTAGDILLDEVQNTTAGVLQSVTLTMKVELSNTGTFKVVVAAVGADGTPTRVQTIASVSYMALTTGFAPITVTAPTTILLQANTAYYVGIQRGVGARSSVHLGNTLDPNVLARPTVQAGANYYNNGGVQANSGGPYEIKLTTVVPGTK